jgi:hypothetical protein
MTRLVIDSGACKLLPREVLAGLRGASRLFDVAAFNYLVSGRKRYPVIGSLPLPVGHPGAAVMVTAICLVTGRIGLLTPIDCNVVGLFFDSPEPSANRSVIAEVELTFVRDVGVSIQRNVGD